MKKTDFCKLVILYPDGTINREDNVSETYRNAIRYIGAENVRKLNLKRNSINIVSTVQECLYSSGGKKESTSQNENGLVICVQFSTKAKFDVLNEVNKRCKANLEIHLVSPDEEGLLNEEEVSKEIKEGLLKQYLKTTYERSRLARQKCLEYYQNKPVCQICGFDFEKVYGERPDKEPFIEIHHIDPLSTISKEKGNHKVNYKTDLIPLCSNCHSMIHYYGKETLTPSELKELYKLHNK